MQLPLPYLGYVLVLWEEDFLGEEGYLLAGKLLVAVGTAFPRVVYFIFATGRLMDRDLEFDVDLCLGDVRLRTAGRAMRLMWNSRRIVHVFRTMSMVLGVSINLLLRVVGRVVGFVQ